MSIRVFLTGGSGLIGSHVAERLRHAELEVTALQREGSATGHLEELGCRVVLGDVTDPPESTSDLMRGCHAVVHSAAIVYGTESWNRVHEVNVEGTRRIAAAAVRAGVVRFIHVSSVAAYGRHPAPITEEAPLRGGARSRSDYARSKREAEEALGEARRRGMPSVAIVRPAVVYGERDRLFSPRLARLATLPLVPLLGSGRSLIPVVYAGNVASLVEHLLDNDAEGAFNLAEDEPTSQEDLVLGLARALGRAPRAVRIPRALVRGAARASDRLRVRLPGTTGLGLARAAWLWTGGNPYRSTRVREVLGWEPAVRRAVALERTAAWLIRTGVIDPS